MRSPCCGRLVMRTGSTYRGEHLADVSLDRRRDGEMSHLLEVRAVEVAVGRDTVEIEQFAAELVADLSE